jgi:hypothetical protein
MNKRRKSKLYRKVEQFVMGTFRPHDPALGHLLRTVDWILVLNPNADDSLLIAGVSHDIERAWSNDPLGAQQEDMQKYTSEHQKRSAEIMELFLTATRAPATLVQRVKELITKHETGGNDDQNLLNDADSLSFLENLSEIFINESVSILGVERVRWKIEWTFTRISSEKAKQIALPLYKSALQRLRSIYGLHR